MYQTAAGHNVTELAVTEFAIDSIIIVSARTVPRLQNIAFVFRLHTRLRQGNILT